jgi:hypothetical protein
VACNTNLCGCYPPGLAGNTVDNYSALFSTQLGSRCGGAPLPPDPVCDASLGAVEVEAEAAALADMRALAVDMNATWSCGMPDAATAQEQVCIQAFLLRPTTQTTPQSGPQAGTQEHESLSISRDSPSQVKPYPCLNPISAASPHPLFSTHSSRLLYAA